MREFGGLWNTGNTCYVNSVLQCLFRLPGFLPALPCRDSWLAARLAAHVEPPRDVAASAEDIDAADIAASAQLEEWMEAFRTEEACARRRRVAFSNIQQSLRAAAVDEEQLKRQLVEMRNCFTTATTQQDPYLFLEFLTRAHDDFTFGLTTNTQCDSCQHLSSQHFPKTSLSLLPTSQTLQGCLNDFMRLEHIGDTGTTAEPAINCPHCRTPSTRRSPSLRTQWKSFSEFPNILVFRLEPVGLLGNRATNVQLPSRLLADDLCAYATNAETGTKSYTLSMVVYFVGQVFADTDGAGHYYAACLSQDGETWSLYNDETVTRIGEPSAENAYMLFYRSTCQIQRSAPASTDAGAPTNGPTVGTSADAASGLDGTSADAASHLQLLSAKELWQFWVKCAKLQEDIVERNHKGRQGRRTADDTARMNFIDRCVLPGLRRGKLPSEYDQKMLFLGSQRDQGLSKPHKQELALWARQQQKRSLASQEEALNPRFRQDTLKSYLTKIAMEEQTPELRKGRPKLAYRFTFGDKEGKTLHDVQRTDPSYLRWLFGPENCFDDDESPFMWDFHAHWRLFIECQRLCAEHDGQREFRVYSRKGQHAETVMIWKLAIRPELTAAFEDYVVNVFGSDAERAANAAKYEMICAAQRAREEAGVDEEDREGEAPVVEHRDAELSRVSAATMKLFKRTCADLRNERMDPYPLWPSRIVRHPDPMTCYPFDAEAWNREDIDFFDPGFYPKLIDMRCLPCINHG